jgi:hypothetical protein
VPVSDAGGPPSAQDAGAVGDAYGASDAQEAAAPPPTRAEPDCLRYDLDAGTPDGGTDGGSPEAGTMTSMTVTENGETYSCQYVLQDAEQDFSDLPAIAANQGALLPGIIYRESSLVHGRFDSLPIPRSGGQYYITLNIPNPTVSVSQVTSISAQQAVSQLTQAAATAIDVNKTFSLPAFISSSISTVWSFDQSMMASGFSLEFETPYVSAGFSQSDMNLSSVRRFGVIVKLYQPMFTIHFADDQFLRNVQLFSNQVQWDGANGECAYDFANDRAAIVDSVTYGRLIVYMLVNNQQDYADADSFSASVSGQVGGVGAGGSVSSATTYQNLVNSSTLTQLALGGPQTAAINAIKTGDFTAYFVPAQVQEAVPLVFTAKRLIEGRPQEIVHDATTFAERKCCRSDSGCQPTTVTKTVCSGNVNRGGNLFGMSDNCGGAVCHDCDPNYTHTAVTTNPMGGGGYCAFDSWTQPNNPSSCGVNLHCGAGSSQGINCDWEVTESTVVQPTDVMCCK